MLTSPAHATGDHLCEGALTRGNQHKRLVVLGRLKSREFGNRFRVRPINPSDVRANQNAKNQRNPTTSDDRQ